MSRKGENICKRKDGRYEARYVKERDSKGRIIKYGYVYAKSYIAVKRKREDEMKNYKKLNELNNAYKNKHFKDAILEWLDWKIYLKKSSYTNYYSIINAHIIPYFKDKKLDSFNDNTIMSYIKYLQKLDLSNKRIKDILLVLKQFLEYHKIHLSFVMPKIPKTKVITLDEKEVQIIEQKAMSSNEIKEFAILLVLFSGLRIGELCALKWSDIDFDNKTMKVSKTVIRIKNNEKGKQRTKVIIDTPKTESSIRLIPIHDFLFNKLKELKKDNSSYILTGTSNCMTTQKYYDYYKKFLKKCSLNQYRFHVLRHTFATRALLSGMDIKTLSEILGHSGVKITLDCYVHIKESEKRMQINKLPFNNLSQSF